MSSSEDEWLFVTAVVLKKIGNEKENMDEKVLWTAQKIYTWKPFEGAAFMTKGIFWGYLFLIYLFFFNIFNSTIGVLFLIKIKEYIILFFLLIPITVRVCPHIPQCIKALVHFNKFYCNFFSSAHLLFMFTPQSYNTNGILLDKQ